jgi:hypothetical protein
MSGAPNSPCLTGSLRLVARAAAAAFCRHQGKRLSPRRTSAWTPVLLRWRKEIGSRPEAVLRAPGWTGLHTSQFQLHFHLAALLGAAVARGPGRVRAADDASVGLSNHALALRFTPMNCGRMFGNPADPARLPARVGKERIAIRGRAPPAGPARSPPAANPQASRPAPMWNAPTSHRTARPATEQFEVAAKLAPGPGSAPMAHSIQSRRHPLRWIRPSSQEYVAGRLAPRASVPPSTPRAARSTMTLATAGPTAPRANRVQRSKPLFELSHESARMHGARRRFRRTRSPDATEIHPSMPARGLAMSRAVDLAWRTGPGGASVAVNLPRHGASPSMPGSPAQSTPAAAPALAAAPRTNGKLVVCATALDPTLAVRVAEDVIRRIDHRVRIERERRGL